MEVFTPSVITIYGYAHTVISVLTMIAGLWALYDAGRFSGQRPSGTAFYGLSLIGIVTGVTIFHHGGFGPGHGLSGVMLVLLAIAYFSSRSGRWLWEVIAASFLYFLIWFFATTETLTRVPIDHPYASSPVDPALIPVRGILLLITLALIYLQYRNAKLVR